MVNKVKYIAVGLSAWYCSIFVCRLSVAIGLSTSRLASQVTTVTDNDEFEIVKLSVSTSRGELLAQVEFKGLTDSVRFDEIGLRRGYKMDVIEVNKRGGLDKVRLLRYYHHHVIINITIITIIIIISSSSSSSGLSNPEERSVDRWRF